MTLCLLTIDIFVANAFILAPLKFRHADHIHLKHLQRWMVVDESTNEQLPSETNKLRSRLLKSLRQVSLRYSMLEPGDKIMVCVSGGKDSATLLHLLLHMQAKLNSIGTNFEIVAVHLNQMQPGYDGTSLVA